MVQDFVQQCGGELHIESAPNVGTTIKMFLPASREIEDQEVPAGPDNALPTGTETILVVEDREGVRRFACRTLHRLGYRTFEAEDAAAALSVLRENEEIDLLFSDIVMPGENSGRDLARIVAKERPGIKVLLTTGMEPNKSADVPEEDQYPVLAKPYSVEDLARTIRTILDAEK